MHSPDEILHQLESLLDDYFISRSVDDTDIEQRIPALFLAYGAACAAAERERCAQIAQDMGEQQVVTYSRDIAFDIAAAIRALPD